MANAFEQLKDLAMTFADAALWTVSDADTLARLDLVQQAEQALTAVKLHLIREISGRDLPARECALSSATWLSNRLRIKPGTARQLVDLGQTLESRPVLDRALSDGVVNTEQALVIQDCISTMPAEVGRDTIDDAERLLIEWSADFHALKLRHLAGRILEHVAPEIAEEIEAKKLTKLEAEAHDARAFTLSSPVNGMVRLRGTLDLEAAAIMEAALDPLCSPRSSAITRPVGAPGSGSSDDDSNSDGNGNGRFDGIAPDDAGTDGADHSTKDERRPEQRRADALIEVCRLALRTGELPVNGGEPAQVSVVVRYEALRDNLEQFPPDFLTDLVNGAADDGPELLPPTLVTVGGETGSSAATTGRSASDRTATDRSATDRTAANRSANDRTATDRSAPSGIGPRRSAAGRPAAGPSASGRPAAGPSASERSAARPSASGRSVGGLRRGQFGIGTLGNGQRISPATVRRIACDARILPAVLDAEGQVLDVGRGRRLFDGHLRRALVLRDRGCAFPTCSRPARWSEGHHIVSWADGGPTSLDNAVLLCREHHRTIHHTDWAVRLGFDGLPEFIPPPYLDRQRRPRRNIYHRRT